MGSGASKNTDNAADDKIRQLPGSAHPPKSTLNSSLKQTSNSANDSRAVTVSHKSANDRHNVTGSPNNNTHVSELKNGGPEHAHGENGHVIRPKSRLQSARRMKR